MGEGRRVWLLVGRGQECCQSSCKVKETSRAKIYPVNATKSAEIEKPCSSLAFLIILLNTPKSFLEYYVLSVDNHGISGRLSTSLSVWVWRETRRFRWSVRVDSSSLFATARLSGLHQTYLEEAKAEDLSNLPVTFQASYHTSQDQCLSALASSVMRIRFHSMLRKLGFTTRFF